MSGSLFTLTFFVLEMGICDIKKVGLPFSLNHLFLVQDNPYYQNHTFYVALVMET